MRIFNNEKYKELKKNTTFNKIFSNMSWLMLERVVRMALGFFVTVWLARYLGPEDFGIYNYGLAVVTIIGAIVPLGLVGYVVKELVSNKEDYNEIMGSTFIARLLSGLVGFIVTTIIAYFAFWENDKILFMVLLIMGLKLLFQAFDVIDLWYQATVKSKYAVISKSVALLLTSILKVVGILLEYTVVYFAFILLLESIFIAIFLVYTYLKNNWRITNWKINFKRMKALVIYTWPLIFSGLAAVIYLKVDQLMIHLFLGEESVGIYSAAVKLSEVWYFVPVAIVSSVFPLLIQSKQTSEVLYKERLQKLFDFLFLISFMVTIPISLFSQFIIDFLYGVDYSEAGLILKIHIWASVFVFMRAALSKWLINEELLIFSLISHLTGAIANVAFNFIFIPVYGGNGAAVGTLLSFFASTYLFCYFSKKTLPMAKIMSLSILSPVRFFINVFK